MFRAPQNPSLQGLGSWTQKRGLPVPRSAGWRGLPPNLGRILETALDGKGESLDKSPITPGKKSSFSPLFFRHYPKVSKLQAAKELSTAHVGLREKSATWDSNPSRFEDLW